MSQSKYENVQPFEKKGFWELYDTWYILQNRDILTIDHRFDVRCGATAVERNGQKNGVAVTSVVVRRGEHGEATIHAEVFVRIGVAARYERNLLICLTILLLSLPSLAYFLLSLFIWPVFF